MINIMVDPKVYSDYYESANRAECEKLFPKKTSETESTIPVITYHADGRKLISGTLEDRKSPEIFWEETMNRAVACEFLNSVTKEEIEAEDETANDDEMKMKKIMKKNKGAEVLQNLMKSARQKLTINKQHHHQFAIHNQPQKISSSKSRHRLSSSSTTSSRRNSIRRRSIRLASNQA